LKFYSGGAAAPTLRRLNVLFRSPPLYSRGGPKMARQLFRGVRPSGHPESSGVRFSVALIS